MSFLVLIAIGVCLYYGIRFYRKEKYFKSEEFLNRKYALAEVVNDHNEMVNYINEIRNRGTFEFGTSSTGQYSHLATFTNTSRHRYKRDRNTVTVAPHVHNCSLQVVRRASQEPIKYLMKYFGFTANEETLQRVEAMGESISQLEEAVNNLSVRESLLTQTVQPPKFILKHYMQEFMSHMGVALSHISVPYPHYIFEYVSAGGNSGQRASITLDSQTIDALIVTMSERIRFRKSVAGQRALMTVKLRNQIKQRDNFTCRSCGISTYEEPHLLLEIDHIIPLSRGGMTEISNLQTLCWRCNRSKSNKMPS